MAKNDFGFGFKPIEEFTFDDCFVRIEQNRFDGVDSDNELLERYSELLSLLQQKDDASFKRATNRAAIDVYISSHPLDKTAKKYQLRHIQELKQKIAAIDESSKRKESQSLITASIHVRVVAAPEV